MQTVKVHLGPRSYSVLVGRNEWPAIQREIEKKIEGRRTILATSPLVARHCLQGGIGRQLGRIVSQKIIVPDRERAKTLKTVQGLYDRLIAARADRQTVLLIVGGGVLGDLAGFVASTYLRGIPYIQIPTTLVAQVDSSVGGKVAVDLPQGKNLVGLFSQPLLVAAETSLLKTLPPREFRAGLAEVVKCGLIADRRLFSATSGGAALQGDPEKLQEIVSRSVRIKAGIVSRDERETGDLRRQLNFGHTIGHALERLTGFRRYRHGEAVSIGIVAAARISARLGYCSGALPTAIERHLGRLGLPTRLPLFSHHRWLEAIKVDKKGEAGMIRFVFLREIGRTVVCLISGRRLVSLL